MRRSAMMIAALAALLLPTHSLAVNLTDPGGGFIGERKPKVKKTFYVVRKDNGCALVAGKAGEVPVGALDNAPYADKNYAKAALAKFPECKGGLVEDENAKKND